MSDIPDKPEVPKLTVEYPTADELRAFGDRCNALSEAVKSSRGFMGVAAMRVAIDLDYLARIVDADPVKQIGQLTLVIKTTMQGKAKGGRAGGKARAAKLSPERRKEIAQKAASKRWSRP